MQPICPGYNSPQSPSTRDVYIQGWLEANNLGWLDGFVKQCNPSGNQPYHNNQHMREVANIAWELAQSCDEELDMNSLMIAAYLHDFSHSGGVCADAVNIDRAIGAVLPTVPNAQAVIDLIRVTEFPFVRRPVTPEQKCLRDADLLQAMMSGDPTIVMEGLRTEMEVALQRPIGYREMVDKQIEFLSNATFFTEKGKQLFEHNKTAYFRSLRAYADAKEHGKIKRAVLIYHKDCLDGFGARFVAQMEFNYVRECSIYPVAATYGDAPPALEPGDHVYILDFSYPLHVLIEMCKTAAKVVVLDHHKTAIEQIDNAMRDVKTIPDNLELFLDTNQSGAGLTYQYFYPQSALPWYIEAIQDCDLQQFQHEDTREIAAALSSYRFDIAEWKGFFFRGREAAVKEGQTALRIQEQQVQWHLDNLVTHTLFDGYEVPMVNCPRYLASEIGSRLSPTAPFAMLWYETPTHCVYSLRSSPGGVDVSAIATKYGGGGDKNAASFQLGEINMNRSITGL